MSEPRYSTATASDTHVMNGPNSETTHINEPTAQENEPNLPNNWARWRYVILVTSCVVGGMAAGTLLLFTLNRYRLRAPAAEFLRTLILVCFGAGGTSQVTLSNSQYVTNMPKGVSVVRSTFGMVLTSSLRLASLQRSDGDSVPAWAYSLHSAYQAVTLIPQYVFLSPLTSTKL
jgi:hypothetical protein